LLDLGERHRGVRVDRQVREALELVAEDARGLARVLRVGDELLGRIHVDGAEYPRPGRAGSDRAVLALDRLADAVLGLAPFGQRRGVVPALRHQQLHVVVGDTLQALGRVLGRERILVLLVPAGPRTDAHERDIRVARDYIL